MPTHVVSLGDHLARIAANHGFGDYRTVYDHAENAELRKLRPNPNVLVPGDQVAIPAREQKQESVNTGGAHRFVVERTDLRLRIRFLAHGGDPVVERSCELHVDSSPSKKTLDGRGIIEHEILPTVERATVVWLEPTAGFSPVVCFFIGYLEPVSESTGQAARLTNLGYYLGPVPIEHDDDLRLAVEEFQCDEALSVDGICGPKTQRKLEEVHGC